MKFAKPDGEIEIVSSGCCCPPGERGRGMHTNAITHWCRTNSGQWRKLRGTSGALLLADAANTCAEFEEAIEKSK